MKTKPYPIMGHACFYPHRDNPYWATYRAVSEAIAKELDERMIASLRSPPLLAPKRVVKRAKKKKKAHK